MAVSFNSLKKDLDKLQSKYDGDKEKLRAKLEIASNKFFSSKKVLIEEIKKVCPHEKEVYHDDWHPHTRDGDQYYKCVLCGNERKV